MSSTTNNYFLNVNTYFRDTDKYPNPCDFGINFSRFDGTGTFVQGSPLNPQNFFQEASIDPDYIDNNLQFENATISQINKTSTTLLVSGIFNFTIDFKINYLNTTLYIQTGYTYPTNTYLTSGGYATFYDARSMPLPFLASLKFDSNAIIPYSIDWLFYIKPSILPEVYFNYSTKAAFQITQSDNIYLMFDFCLREFDFVVWKNNIVTYLSSATNPTIDTRTTYQFGGNYGAICTCLVYISKNGDVGIANNHSYGFHIFSSNFDILPTQSNGSFSIETDLAESAYVSLSTNPFRALSKYGPPQSLQTDGSFLGTNYNYEGGKTLHFTNSTGTVVPVVTQYAFSPFVVVFTTGPYKVGFIIENSSNPYLDFQTVIPEPTTNYTQIVSQTWFTGSNKIFATISSIIGTSLTSSTGSSIFTVDPNTFTMTKVARLNSTGAGSVAYADIGSQIYLINNDLQNFLSVYDFNTTTYVLTYLNGIQLPSLYFFLRTVFTIRDGTDFYIYSLPCGAGFNPSTYFRELRQTGFVLKYSTTLNSLSIINSLQFDVGATLNYAALSLRPDTGKKYWFKSAFNKNQILIYDITNPYSVIESSTTIGANSNCNLFPYSQTINGVTKYYLLIQTIGGSNSIILYDVTDINKFVSLGIYYDLKITGREFPVPTTVVGPINEKIYSFVYNGFSYNTPCLWKMPTFPQSITSSHARQNLARTIDNTGAQRCSTFNIDNTAYVATISNTAFKVFDITSIRAAKMISSSSIFLPTTIYDMTTIRFNNNQYFLVAGLGYVFAFILNQNLTSITPVGLFTSVPDAYSECRFFESNKQLFSVILSYTGRLYRFSLNPLLVLQTFTLVEAGKIPAMGFLGINPITNMITLQVTTSNFTTSNDFAYSYNLTSGITLIQTVLTLPGGQPRSSSQAYNVNNGQLFYSLYANIGIGLLRVDEDLFLNSNWLNTIAVNIPTNLNGMTRLFYTDKLYMLANQYGGVGSLGDYLNIFDLSNTAFGVETFIKGISIGSTGVSTGAPASSLDIQISQINDRVTAVMLNNNGTFYLYDISNPEYAGQFQNQSVVSSVYDLGISYGAGTIFKLNNEGEVLFNNSLRSNNTGTSVNGQLVNISNIKLSSDGLSIYVSGGWKDKIQSFNPTSLVPSNQISANQGYNGFVAKCDALNGNWIWIIPVYGEGEDFVQKLQYISSKDKIVVIGYTSSDICIVYQKQNAGTLTNPTIPQKSIVGSISSTNSFVLSITSSGITEWVTNSYSNEASRFVNFLDVGTQNDKIVVSGNTNASVIENIDSSGNLIQTLYTNIESITENSIINYTFDLSGIYQNSTSFLYPPFTVTTCNDIKLFSDLNEISICPVINYNSFTTSQYFNRDGSLAHTDTGTANAITSYVVNYKIESRYTDDNGNKYSIIKLNNPPNYTFTGGFMTNYNMYILGNQDDINLNKNFSIRNNFESPTGNFKIILNNSISVNKINKNLFQVNNLTGSENFYNINISPSPLISIFEYNINQMPTVNNTITSVGLTSLKISNNYYIIFPKYGSISYVPVQNITIDANGDYVFQLQNVNDLRISTGGSFYGPYLYLTQFNQNIFYNLQFYPSSLNTPVYYSIQLNSLVLPNRPLRQNPENYIKTLTDMPYIYVAIYSVDDEDLADREIVNIVYDNNPNREKIEIFQLNTVNAGDTSNFVTYTSSTVPKVKFNSTFTTLRIKIFDPYGNILLFDNTPYKSIDSRFTGDVVPNQFMNISIQFTLIKKF
jgi:hypothetical protein